MEKRIKQIEKSLRVQRMYSLAVTCLLGVFLLLSFKEKGAPDIIKAKGIIIVDEKGRERILIGAPLPYAKNRVRTDTARVKQIWGKNFSKKYMEWYKNYDHNANGMVILDENGFDRIAIGHNIPDPNIGKRIGPATGLIINDEQGFERSGYNLINIKGQNRMVLGLDRPGGTEGVILSILEDGTAGLNINNKESNAFLGNAPQSSFMTGMDHNFFGLMIKEKADIKYNFNSANKQ